MTRLSLLVGVLLTLSIGVAATVVAQTPPCRQSFKRSRAANNRRTRQSVDPRPVLEYEFRIWKRSPVTPTMKMRAVPGETSELKILKERCHSIQAAEQPFSIGGERAGGRDFGGSGPESHDPAARRSIRGSPRGRTASAGGKKGSS